MLDKNRLKLKYGDTKIMAIHNDDITATMDISHFKDGFMHKMYALNMQKLFKNVSYLYRYDAEVDSDYKQPIPYVIFYHRPTKRFFYTERMQGDERLIGRKSLGIGGHVDDQEEFTSCLYREIKEEIGLRKEQIVDLSFKGFLLESPGWPERLREIVLHRPPWHRFRVAGTGCVLRFAFCSIFWFENFGLKILVLKLERGL